MQVKRQDETMEVSPQQAAKLLRHGWHPVIEQVKEQVREEVIRLKPAVKSKATVTAIEEANINNKGDE